METLNGSLLERVNDGTKSIEREHLNTNKKNSIKTSENLTCSKFSDF